MPSLQGILSVAPQSGDEPALEIVRAMPPRIQVHDAGFNMISKGFGSLQENLDEGLYLVHVENGPTPFEQVVRVPAGGKVQVTYPVTVQPQRLSAGVVYGSSGLHEYTGEYARHLSRTVAEAKFGSGARLVILASRADYTQAAPIEFRSLRLLGADGKVLADLSQTPLATGLTDPLLSTAYAAEVPGGGYVIEWKDEWTPAASCWRQPLWVPSGWVLMVFLNVPPGKAVPEMNSASIHLVRLNEEFEPRASSASAAESALISLRTGRQLLSLARLDSDLLEKKFENPMLGIYGAHMILQRSMPGTEKAQILAEVLKNLEILVPGSPDVAALRLMSREILGSDPVPPGPPCAWPPMIRAGYVAYREADYQASGAFIQSSSVSDGIRTALVSGGVWTRWSAERNNVSEFHSATLKLVKKAIHQRLSGAVRAAGLPVKTEQVKEFSSAIADAGFVLGKHVLSALAPTLADAAIRAVNPEMRQVLGKTLSSLNRVSASASETGNTAEQDALADLAWTGLNKSQIKAVADSVLRSNVGAAWQELTQNG